jgi:hypothetical protein
VALTQPRAFGAHTGRGYGSFADKAQQSHPVGVLTHPRSHGAFTGRRYGSFAGKSESRSVGILTQARAFGAFTGQRYGSFAGRLDQTPVPPINEIPSNLGGRRVFAVRHPRDDEEELFLLITAALHVLDS